MMVLASHFADILASGLLGLTMSMSIGIPGDGANQGRAIPLFSPGAGLILMTLADVGQIFGTTTRPFGTAPPTVTFAGQPTAPLGLRVKIVGAGALGAATYAFSENNGVSFSSALPTAATVALTGPKSTGLSVNFPAGAYSADNYWEPTFTEWRDQSGANITTVRNGTPSFSPSFVTSSLVNAGKAAYRFDSTLINLFRWADPLNQVSFGPCTIIVQLCGTATNIGVHTWIGFNNVGDVSQNQEFNYHNFGSTQMQRGNPAVTSSRNSPVDGWLNTNPHVMAWRQTGTHAGNVTFIDNVDVSTAWPTVTGNDPGVAIELWNYGSLGATAGGSFRFDGDMRSFYIWNRALTNAEMAIAYAQISAY